MKIEKDVPVSKPKKGRPLKWIFGELKINDSFLITKQEQAYIRSSLRQYNIANETAIKLKVHQEGDTHYRCWRVE